MFATVQSRNDFLTSSEEADDLIKNGFRLVGTEVFSRAGNRLGVIESYEFDTVYGKITKIILGKKLSFGPDDFVFFTPEFVFVDDGETTSLDVKTGTKPSKKAKQKVKAGKKVAPKKAVKAAPAVEDAKPEPEPAPEPVSAPEPEVASEDDELKSFLIGQKVTEDVESADGEFKVAQGTELTKELVDEAVAHDALLLLTMSVED